MTPHNKIIDKLHELKVRVKELYRDRRILISTKNLLTKYISKLEEDLNYLKKEKIGDPEFEKIASFIISQIFLIEDILNRVGEKIDKLYIRFAEELLSKLHDNNFQTGKNLDIFIIPINTKGMRTYFCITGQSMTFVLCVYNKIYPFNIDFMGLVAHEISHTEPIIDSFAASTNLERRKIGEILADFLASIMTGFLFLHSTVKWLENIQGVNNIYVETPTHPAWITRLYILKEMSKKIWKNHILRTLFNDCLNKYVLDISCIISKISSNEEKILSKGIIECNNLKDNFYKYKLNESIVGDKKKMEEDKSIIINLHSKIMDGGR